MNILGIIQSLQDLVFEIVVWVLLLPKTLTKAILRPDLMVKYVNEEWKKEKEDQFDEYLHPILFFLITAVVPSALFAWISNPASIANAFNEQNLMISVTTSMVAIVLYLIWLEWLNKRPLKRSSLKRLFDIQCYLITPVQFIYVLLLSIFKVPETLVFVGAAGAFLQIVYEAFAFHDELKVSWPKSVWYAALPQLGLFTFATIIALIATSPAR